MVLFSHKEAFYSFFIPFSAIIHLFKCYFETARMLNRWGDCCAVTFQHAGTMQTDPPAMFIVRELVTGNPPTEPRRWTGRRILVAGEPPAEPLRGTGRQRYRRTSPRDRSPAIPCRGTGPCPVEHQTRPAGEGLGCDGGKNKEEWASETQTEKKLG